MTSNRFYIGGEWVDVSDREQHTLFDPVTEVAAGEVALSTKADIDRKQFGPQHACFPPKQG